MPRTKKVLLLLAISFGLDGLVQPFVPPQNVSGVLLVHAVLIGVLCYMWAKAEAAERNAVAPGRSALWAGIFPLLGIPAYFFRTRPLAAASLGTGKAVMLIVVLSVADSLLSKFVEILRS